VIRAKWINDTDIEIYVDGDLVGQYPWRYIHLLRALAEMAAIEFEEEMYDAED